MVTQQIHDVLELYNRGLTLYKERDFLAAKEQFQKALEIQPEDGPSKLYVERCEFFIKEPPPTDWDGVFVMKTK